MGETESGVFCSPPSGGLAALGLLLLLVAGGLLVIGPVKHELQCEGYAGGIQDEHHRVEEPDI